MRVKRFGRESSSRARERGGETSPQPSRRDLELEDRDPSVETLGYSQSSLRDASVNPNVLARGRPHYVKAIQPVIPMALLALILALPGGAAAAGIMEDFATDPGQRGWRVFGDSSLFQWNQTNQNLEVTWDSSRSNSFFYLPLGTVLTKSDDFSFSFDLRLFDIRVGSTAGKSNEFEIAVGLLNYNSATNSKAFRGAGVSATYGVRNVVEFDYFPDAGFGDTFATTVISSNNVFAYQHNFPLTLSLGDTFRITMAYTASNQVLRTFATQNGLPFSPLGDVFLGATPDFRVDTFSVISYSDAIQAGSPVYYGSVLAHGAVDNVQTVTPAPPLSKLQLWESGSGWAAEFMSLTNWTYVLEGSADLRSWAPASGPAYGNGGTLQLTDTNAPARKMFYRVQAERL